MAFIEYFLHSFEVFLSSEAHFYWGDGQEDEKFWAFLYIYRSN